MQKENSVKMGLFFVFLILDREGTEKRTAGLWSLKMSFHRKLLAWRRGGNGRPFRSL